MVPWFPDQVIGVGGLVPPFSYGSYHHISKYLCHRVRFHYFDSLVFSAIETMKKFLVVSIVVYLFIPSYVVAQEQYGTGYSEWACSYGAGIDISSGSIVVTSPHASVGLFEGNASSQEASDSLCPDMIPHVNYPGTYGNPYYDSNFPWFIRIVRTSNGQLGSVGLTSTGLLNKNCTGGKLFNPYTKECQDPCDSALAGPEVWGSPGQYCGANSCEISTVNPLTIVVGNDGEDYIYYQSQVNGNFCGPTPDVPPEPDAVETGTGNGGSNGGGDTGGNGGSNGGNGGDTGGNGGGDTGGNGGGDTGDNGGGDTGGNGGDDTGGNGGGDTGGNGGGDTGGNGGTSNGGNGGTGNGGSNGGSGSNGGTNGGTNGGECVDDPDTEEDECAGEGDDEGDGEGSVSYINCDEAPECDIEDDGFKCTSIKLQFDNYCQYEVGEDDNILGESVFTEQDGDDGSQLSVDNGIDGFSLDTTKFLPSAGVENVTLQFDEQQFVLDMGPFNFVMSVLGLFVRIIGAVIAYRIIAEGF